MEKKTCAKCGAEVEYTANFCPGCGSQDFTYPAAAQESAQDTAGQPGQTESEQTAPVTEAFEQPAQSQQAAQNPYPYPPAAKKKGFKWWHILLIVVGAIVALIILLVAVSSGGRKSSGYTKNPANSYTHTTSEASSKNNETNIEDIIVGQWKFDVSDLDFTDNTLYDAMFMATGSSGETIEEMKNILGESFFKDVLSSFFGAYTLNFLQDDTAYFEVDANKLFDVTIEMYEKTYDRLAEMRLEDVAKIQETTVEELKKQLNGKTWREYIDATKEFRLNVLKSQSGQDFAENLAESMKGELNGSIIKYAAGGYSVSGNRLALFDTAVGTSDEKTIELVCSYNNGYLKIEKVDLIGNEDITDSPGLTFLRSGVSLKKVS